MKKPWIAALLNVIPGLGYLYLGVRKTFAYLLLAGTLFAFADSFNPKITEYMTEYPITIPMVVAILLTWVAFIIDAYFEAVRIGSRSKSSK